MKKLLFTLIFCFVTVSNAMDTNPLPGLITKKAWNSLIAELTIDRTSEQCAAQVTELLGVQADLNASGSWVNGYLLTALLYGIHAPNRDKQSRDNARFMLKKLVEAGRLDLELRNQTGQYIVNEACVAHNMADGTYAHAVAAISKEIAQEKMAKASIFHTHESSLSTGLGVEKVEVRWHPLCVLVDYRFWTSVVIAAGLYAWYKRATKTQDVADEQEEDSKQATQEIVTVQ